MRKFIIILILLSSCRQISEPKLDKERARKIIKKSLIQGKQLAAVDTIIISDIKHFTPKLDTIRRLVVMDAKLSIDSVICNTNYDSLIEKRNEYSKKKRGDMGVYYFDLYDWNEDAIEDYERSKSEMTSLEPRRRAARELIKSGKIDSITSTGYYITFRALGADSSNIAITKESLIMILNNDYRIIPYSEINNR